MKLNKKTLGFGTNGHLTTRSKILNNTISLLLIKNKKNFSKIFMKYSG